VTARFEAKQVPADPELISVPQHVLPSHAYRCAIRRPEIVQREGARRVLDANRGVTPRQKWILRENDVSILASDDRFVTKKVVKVAADALSRVLHESREASDLGRTEHEYPPLKSWSQW
jgi:hypothetical protein